MLITIGKGNFLNAHLVDPMTVCDSLAKIYAPCLMLGDTDICNLKLNKIWLLHLCCC